VDKEIHSIIEAVRTREERRRRTALGINAALLGTTLSVPMVLWQFYPAWLVLLWLAPLAVAGIFISQSEYESIRVTREEASAILDSVLKTKERVRTFTLISHSSEAPDLVRSAFIAQQIRESIPPSFTPANLLDVRLTKPQRWALAACAAGAILSLALFIFRPLSSTGQIAATLQEIINAHPELPKSVELAVQESIKDLSSSDLAAAQDSLQKTQEEITRALAATTAPSKDDRTIEQKDGTAPKLAPDAPEKSQHSPPPTQKQEPSPKVPQPQQQQDTGDKQQENQQKKEGSEPQSSKDSLKQEKNSGKQQSPDSTEKAEEGNSDKGATNKEQQGESDQQKDSKQAGASKSGQSKKSEDGDGQGSGQGQGSNGSGSGNQGQNQQGSGNSQGTSDAAKEGHGQGQGSSQEAKGSSQSQSGSAKTGEQKEGSTPGDSGLNQLKDAVAKAQQEVQKEQGREEKGDQEGKKGEQGKGEGNKESATGKQGEGKGKQGDSPKGQQQGNAASKENLERKGNSQGKQGEGDREGQSKGDSKKGDTKPKDEGANGSAGSSQKKAHEQNPQDNQESGDTDADGAGEKSSMPDRSAQTVNEAPPSDGVGSDMPGLPPPVKESKIDGAQEQLDARFTGSDSTLEENKAPAKAKTTLDDVILAKPQGSSLKGRQPIPLEYKDMLQ
jgi:hypothetical protein